MEMNLTLGVVIVLTAFIAEYVDSTLGMGYGTTLTPVLLLMGFEPMQIVPAVLLSELFTGMLAGLAHHKAGNANFDLQGIFPGKRAVVSNPLAAFYQWRRTVPLELQLVGIIGFCSMIGVLGAVFVAVTVPAYFLKMYVGIMVLSVGLVILFQKKKHNGVSLKKITCLGLLASFNKGLSGGGYGPVVTGGQIILGVDGKKAVAITSLAEGLTCVVGFSAYWFTRNIDSWVLFPYLCVGAILSVPLSAKTVRRLKPEYLKVAIGTLSTGLGLFTLIKIFN